MIFHRTVARDFFCFLAFVIHQIQVIAAGYVVAAIKDQPFAIR